MNLGQLVQLNNDECLYVKFTFNVIVNEFTVCYKHCLVAVLSLEKECDVAMYPSLHSWCRAHADTIVVFTYGHFYGNPCTVITSETIRSVVVATQ